MVFRDYPEYTEVTMLFGLRALFEARFTTAYARLGAL